MINISSPVFNYTRNNTIACIPTKTADRDDFTIFKLRLKTNLPVASTTADAAIFACWPLAEGTNAHAPMALHWKLTTILAATVMKEITLNTLFLCLNLAKNLSLTSQLCKHILGSECDLKFMPRSLCKPRIGTILVLLFLLLLLLLLLLFFRLFVLIMLPMPPFDSALSLLQFQ